MKNGSLRFDENFGIGSRFVIGEEVDFLVRNHDHSTIYTPEVTVNHRLKEYKDKNKNKVYAKGALYAKHFPFSASLVLIKKDLLQKKENNFLSFYEGFLHTKKK